MSWMSFIGGGVGILPSLSETASYIRPDDGIPSAKDDWDHAFEEATGSLPPFSPLRGDSLRQLYQKTQQDLAQSMGTFIPIQMNNRHAPRLADLAGPHHSTAGVK